MNRSKLTREDLIQLVFIAEDDQTVCNFLEMVPWFPKFNYLKYKSKDEILKLVENLSYMLDQNPTDEPFVQYVEWAYQQSLIKGRPERNFTIN